jgi:truncated hemoglobin YjbI
MLGLLAPARAERIFAVDSKTILLSFDSEKPATITSMALIRGLQPGETILGIDCRPANKKLYGLGSTSRIYALDPDTGAATQVGSGQFTPRLEGTEFGFDFNPTVDRIRVTSNMGQNLRLHPDTGAVVSADAPLRYRDDATPRVVASAYTNSVAGATSTTLYNVDLARRAIVTQNPPNDGVLNLTFQIGNADLSDVAGFDISPRNGKGYLAARGVRMQGVQLYEIDFSANKATLTGTVNVFEQISSIAVDLDDSRKTLFERLGGKDALTAVIDQFITNVAGDARINSFFAGTASNPARLAAFKNNLIDQVCEATGGPCKYKGLDMKTAHRGMKISDVEFDALVDDLGQALAKFNVPAEEKAALVALLAPMRPRSRRAWARM